MTIPNKTIIYQNRKTVVIVIVLILFFQVVYPDFNIKSIKFNKLFYIIGIYLFQNKILQPIVSKLLSLQISIQ